MLNSKYFSLRYISNETYAETHTGLQIKRKQLLPDFNQNQKRLRF